MRLPPRPGAIFAMLLAVGLLLSGQPAGAAPAPPGGPPADGGVATARRSGGTQQITLITGDRISSTRQPDGRESVAVQPSPRASGPPPYFEVNGDATGYYVIPSDVRPQLRADAWTGSCSTSGSWPARAWTTGPAAASR
jgi:hypothetical protein